MTETLVLCLLYVAAAGLYGGSDLRGRARLAFLQARPCRVVVRALALHAIGTAGWLWHGIESGTAAVLVVIAGLMVTSTAVTLLGPVAPRSLWGSVAAAIALIPVLAVRRVP